MTGLQSAPNSTGSGKAAQADSPAPDFTLPDGSGKSVHFMDLVGKSEIVLFFYPQDNSAGCTMEACAFRDSYEAFKDVGAEVIGISPDSADSHQAFSAKHRLPFILLSDQGEQVAKRYGVAKRLGIFPGRVTYIIDRRGIVRHIFSSLVPTQHVADALKAIQALREEHV